MPKAPKKQQPVQRWVSRIGGGSRVVVPAGLRAALRVKQGDNLVFEATGTDVTVRSQAEVLQSLQGKYKERWRAPEFSVDGFLAQRKAMWGEE